MNEKKAIKQLIQELRKYAENIRNDWSEFDGRDLLWEIDQWLTKLSALLNIEYESYYENLCDGEAYKRKVEYIKQVREKYKNLNKRRKNE